MHKIIKFDQKAWLKPNIDMSTELTEKANNYFAVFGKTMENVRKYKDVKLLTKESRRNYLVSERNFLTYHTAKVIWKIYLLN